MTEIPEEELQLLDGAFAELSVLGMELQSQASWMPRLLTGLLNATLGEYQHLRLGMKHSTAMVTWACRNLLDLHIYTRYALASEAGARRLEGEGLRDGLELYDAFQTWLARNDAAMVPAEVPETIYRFTEQLAEAGLHEMPPLRLKRVAADVGLADEWSNMARLSAKLAQPNVFAIAYGGNDLADWRPILFRAGAGHGLEILRLIKETYNPRSVD